MAKSIFTITAKLESKQESILSFSQRLVYTIFLLSQTDQIFKTVKVLNQDNAINQSIEIASNDVEIAKQLAEAILKSNLNDIRIYDKVENPNINYERPFGFSFGISFNDVVTLTFVLGSLESNGIGTISFSKSMTKSFDWYFTLLKGISEGFRITYSKIGFIETSFNQNCKSYKFPLGWITYFSNDHELQIPNELEGVEYEFTDIGKYLILTREDFTTDKETYEAHKQKLLNVMEEIKRRVPEYGK